jgi:hypothetical protein
MNWTSQSPWIPHESKNNVMLKFAGYCLIKMGRWVFDGVLVRYSYLVLSLILIVCRSLELTNLIYKKLNMNSTQLAVSVCAQTISGLILRKTFHDYITNPSIV